MRKSLAFAVAAAVIAATAGSALAQEVAITKRGALTMENVPATPPAVRSRLIQYANSRSASFLDFLPGGGVLIATRFGDTPQLHTVASPGADRRQITFFDDRITGAEVRPGSSGQILFTQDKGGDENYQGFILDPKTGLSTAVTEAGSRNEGVSFSRDGAKIAWARAAKDSGNYDILIGETGKPETRKVVLKGEGALQIADWSPTGDRLLLQQYISITKSRMFVLDIASAKLTELTPELNVSYSGGEFTADGKSIVTVSDENSDFLRLTRIDLATGKRTVLSPEPKWDVEAFDISPDGRTVAYAMNVDGASALKLYDLRTGKPLPSPNLPPGVIGGFGWDEKGERFELTLVSGTSPADVYVYTLKTKALVRWTQSEVGGLDASAFVEPKLVRYKTFDSATGGPAEISAWVFEPKTPGPHPAIIEIHGGPEGQSRPTFSARRQYWVNEMGIAVVVPNVRGSTGYGKVFVSLDDSTKRLDSVKDIGATLDWMQTTGRFDMAKVIPYGGSYGGYMVYAAMIMFPERFVAGVDIVGIGNLRTFLENTSAYRRDLRRAEYGDERDPVVRKWMEETAAFNNADKIKRPMFIIHGDNDPRVPVSEAKAMVAQFRKQGLETWLMTANDEGHGFAKKANQEAQLEAETLFFEKVLGLKPKAQ